MLKNNINIINFAAIGLSLLVISSTLWNLWDGVEKWQVKDRWLSNVELAQEIMEAEPLIATENINAFRYALMPNIGNAEQYVNSQKVTDLFLVGLREGGRYPVWLYHSAEKLGYDRNDVQACAQLSSCRELLRNSNFPPSDLQSTLVNHAVGLMSAKPAIEIADEFDELVLFYKDFAVWQSLLNHLIVLIESYHLDPQPFLKEQIQNIQTLLRYSGKDVDLQESIASANPQIYHFINELRSQFALLMQQQVYPILHEQEVTSFASNVVLDDLYLNHKTLRQMIFQQMNKYAHEASIKADQRYGLTILMQLVVAITLIWLIVQIYFNAIKPLRTSKAIFDTTPSSIIRVSKGGVIEQANESTLKTFGFEGEQLTGMKLSKLLQKNGQPFDSENLSSLTDFSGLGSPGIEFNAMAADGRIFPVLLWVAKTDKTRESDYICLIYDVTQVEQQKRERERKNDQLRVLKLSTESFLVNEDERKNTWQKILNYLLDNTHAKFGAIYSVNTSSTVDVHNRYRCVIDDLFLNWGGEELNLPESHKLRAALDAAVTQGTPIFFEDRFANVQLYNKRFDNGVCIPVIQAGRVTGCCVVADCSRPVDQAILEFLAPYVSNLGILLHALHQTEQQDALVKDLRSARNKADLARQEALEANKAKSTFLANMSHEIRTPMNGIMNLTYLALSSAQDPKQIGYLKKIHRSADVLLRIINDILDFSKVEAGKMEIEVVPLSLESLVDNALALYSESARKKGIDLMAVFEQPDLINHQVKVLGDSVRLEQVLNNLISNAIKFTEKGYVRLQLSAHVVDSVMQLQVDVQDSGIGMTLEQQSKLFNEFTQADASMVRRFGGTGLGLTISQKLMHLMGGEISLSSELGKGTTFSINIALPLDEPLSFDTQMMDAVKGRQAVIIDDSEIVCEILSEQMQRLGMRTKSCLSVVNAVDCIRQLEHPELVDFVLVDCVMPQGGGEAVLQALRKSEPQLLDKVVLMSAYEEEYLIELASKFNIRHTLVKPILPTQLLEQMTMLLRGEDSSNYKVVKPVENATESDLSLSDLQGLRVFLVEDNEINQQVATELLQDQGVIVEVAENGAAALKALETKSADEVDIILMDLQMPVMDGFTATEHLRQVAKWDKTPILAMTAHAFDSEKQRCLSLGMNGHIAKPINPMILYKTLLSFAVMDKESESFATKELVIDSPESAEPVVQDNQIDFSHVLMMVGGKEERLIRFLNDLLDKYSDFGVQAQAYLDKYPHSHEEFYRYIHTFKGVLSTLNMESLREKSLEIEHVFDKDQQPGANARRSIPVLQDMIEACSSELQVVLKQIQGYLSDHCSDEEVVPIESVAKAEIDIALIDEFHQLLATFDGKLQSKWDEHHPQLRAWLEPNQYVQLENAIDQFDFEQGMQVLESVKEGYQQ